VLKFAAAHDAFFSVRFDVHMPANGLKILRKLYEVPRLKVRRQRSGQVSRRHSLHPLQPSDRAKNEGSRDLFRHFHAASGGLVVLTHTRTTNCPGSCGFLSSGVAEMAKPLTTICPRESSALDCICIMLPPVSRCR
jgi:hypothetical protein